jgi:taurine transport system permease protein
VGALRLAPDVARRSPWVTRATGLVWFVAPFLLLLAVWAALVAATGVPLRRFPQVTHVWAAAVQLTLDGTLFTHAWASLRRVGYGVGLALVTGVPFGLLMGINRYVAGFFTPILRFSVALAGIAWIPLATLWFRVEGAIIFIIWNAVFFSLVYNTLLGVSQIPRDMHRAAQSLGTGRIRMFWEVLLPGALPGIVTGVRVGMGYGWRGLIAAEIIAGTAGLGYSLFLAEKFFHTHIIVLMMILIGLVWVLMDRLILAPLERRTVERWGMKQVSP